MEFLINGLIVFLILGLTYALTSEGLWGSALMFFNVLFAALIAFNFYEPLAKLIDSTGIGWGFSDTLCLMLLFSITTLILRMTTETIAPAQVRFPVPIYHAGRLLFGLGGASITMAVILLAFHCAPVYKQIFGVVKYDSRPPFGLGLDHQFLGLFQRESGAVFTQYTANGQRDPYGEYGGPNRLRLNLFDPKAEWLINHQNTRPYGTETVPAEDAAAATSTEGGAEGGQGRLPRREGGAAGGLATTPLTIESGGPVRRDTRPRSRVEIHHCAQVGSSPALGIVANLQEFGT